MTPNTYWQRFHECRDKEDFVDLCIDVLGALDDAEERIVSVVQGQQALMDQTVCIRREILGLQDGEKDTAEGIDTQELAARLRYWAVRSMPFRT
jgi:hypothetical protein